MLNVTNLTFDGSNNYDLNIMALNSSGGAGYVASPTNILNQYSQTNGFKFLNAGSVSNSPGTGDVSSSFDIRSEDFSYYVGNWYGDWGVHHDGSGGFYLTYTAVPEPSTYAMVLGLVGFIFLNRTSRKALFRNARKITGLGGSSKNPNPISLPS